MCSVYPNVKPGRKILIKTYEKTHDVKMIAEIFGVNERTVYERIQDYKERGTTELRTHQRGRKRLITPEDDERIKDLINKNNDITIHEINETVRQHVVMDNMRSHHVKKAAEVLRKANIDFLYLPPYSPDFNPIEKMWSKIKSILRKIKVRSASLLPDAIKNAFSLIIKEDCLGWFKSCGVCC